MKTRLTFIVFLLAVAMNMTAQPGRMKPYWITQLPVANTQNHYYYRVTMAEGTSYDNAYAKAFAKAIMEAKWKIGVRVDFSDDISSLENSVTEGISVGHQSVEIPMNKVCDFWEEVHDRTGNSIRIYVLWQVAEDASHCPKFDDFTKCQ